MIDEKRLEEIESRMSPNESFEFNPTIPECFELISLARLGLWAKEKGIE